MPKVNFSLSLIKTFDACLMRIFLLGLEHPLPRPSEQETGRVSQYMASMKAKAKENVMHRQKCTGNMYGNKKKSGEEI